MGNQCVPGKKKFDPTDDVAAIAQSRVASLSKKQDDFGRFSELDQEGVKKQKVEGEKEIPPGLTMGDEGDSIDFEQKPRKKSTFVVQRETKSGYTEAQKTIIFKDDDSDEEDIEKKAEKQGLNKQETVMVSDDIDDESSMMRYANQGSIAFGPNDEPLGDIRQSDPEARFNQQSTDFKEDASLSNSRMFGTQIDRKNNETVDMGNNGGGYKEVPDDQTVMNKTADDMQSQATYMGKGAGGYDMQSNATYMGKGGGAGNDMSSQGTYMNKLGGLAGASDMQSNASYMVKADANKDAFEVESSNASAMFRTSEAKFMDDSSYGGSVIQRGGPEDDQSSMMVMDKEEQEIGLNKFDGEEKGLSKVMTDGHLQIIKESTDESVSRKL